jgi:NTE family protein
MPGQGTADARAPVSFIPSDAPERGPEDGIALCLSGGGYRAMLFHLGALWRINELGLLPQLARISSVSAGSIVAGLLGLKWQALRFDAAGVGAAFDAEVVAPVRALASRTIDLPAIVLGMFLPGGASARIAAAYRRHVFGRATVQALPDSPRFVMNATDLQSGVLWRFMKPYSRDYRVGEIPHSTVELARAVAASSAFPPFLSPARFTFREADYTKGSGEDLQYAPYTTHVLLTDGGVYDNLGLETTWKRFRTVLVSDAAGRVQPREKLKGNWISQSIRVEELIHAQVGSLRKRQLIASYRTRERQGAYWGIGSDISNYALADALPCPLDQTTELAKIPTRLKQLDAGVQERLIDWGYAICDAALRTHFNPALPKASRFPFRRGV